MSSFILRTFAKLNLDGLVVFSPTNTDGTARSTKAANMSTVVEFQLDLRFTRLRVRLDCKLEV